MNKNRFCATLLVLAPAILVLALDVFARQKRASKRRYSLAARWKYARAQRREARDFQGYLRVVRAQIQADMEIGKRAMQRAGVRDENGELTEKYREFDPGNPDDTR